jgi:hypothetical protein
MRVCSIYIIFHLALINLPTQPQPFGVDHEMGYAEDACMKPSEWDFFILFWWLL